MARVDYDYLSTFQFLGNAGLVLPVDQTGLSAFHLFNGGTIARGLKNWAPGGGDASPVGNPGVNSETLTLTGGVNYIATAAPDSSDLTLIAVAKIKSDADVSGVMLLSNDGSASQQHSGATFGSILFARAGSVGDGVLTGRFSAPKNVGAGGTQVSVDGAAGGIAINSWQCFAGRVALSDGVRHFDNLTTANSTTGAADATARDLGGQFNIGSPYFAGYADATDYLAAIVFNRKLSDGELSAIYNWLRTFAAAQAIPIAI